MSFLIVDSISFSYDGNREILSNVSFSIESNETVALIGPNGSGKTTLSKILTGIYKPTKGKILLDGRDLNEYSLGEIGRKIGYVFQDVQKQFFTSSVEEEIGFGLRLRGISNENIKKKVRNMMAYFELLCYAKEFPFNLSQGEKQRLAIASVLILEPSFLIFDEPTTALDYLQKDKFKEILLKIREMGIGYMLISHDYEFVKSCTERLFYLKKL